TGTADFRRLSRTDRGRAGNSRKQLPVHGQPGAGGGCAHRLRLYQTEVQADPAGRIGGAGDSFQPRTGDCWQACAARRGVSTLRCNHGIPDERPARTGRGLGEAGYAAGSPGGAPGATAAGLFRIPGGRRVSLRLWIGESRADRTKPAVCGGDDLKASSFELRAKTEAWFARSPRLVARSWLTPRDFCYLPQSPVFAGKGLKCKRGSLSSVKFPPPASNTTVAACFFWRGWGRTPRSFR